MLHPDDETLYLGHEVAVMKVKSKVRAGLLGGGGGGGEGGGGGGGGGGGIGGLRG